MILINLLPPELRKRRGGVNPVALAMCASAAVLLLLLGTWLWISYVSIPAARDYLAAQVEKRVALEAKEAEVKQVEAAIADVKKQSEVVVSLIQRKMYWARTVDEAANMLSGSWNLPGFEVRCTEFQVSPASVAAARGGAAAGETIAAMVKARFRLVGMEKDKAGDYVRSFFATVEASPWWRGGGYQDKPETTYRGDAPLWKQDIKRVILDLPLEFRRVKVIPGIGKAAQAPKAGG